MRIYLDVNLCDGELNSDFCYLLQVVKEITEYCDLKNSGLLEPKMRLCVIFLLKHRANI